MDASSAKHLDTFCNSTHRTQFLSKKNKQTNQIIRNHQLFYLQKKPKQTCDYTCSRSIYTESFNKNWNESRLFRDLFSHKNHVSAITINFYNEQRKFFLIKMVFEITRYDLIPIACLPIAFVLGAQSFYCTLFTFIAIVVLLSYIGISIKSRKLQTKFFFAWTICSIVCMWGIFEMTIAPEVILPRERYFLAILTFGALLFFQLVSLNHVSSSE